MTATRNPACPQSIASPASPHDQRRTQCMRAHTVGHDECRTSVCRGGGKQGQSRRFCGASVLRPGGELMQAPFRRAQGTPPDMPRHAPTIGNCYMYEGGAEAASPILTTHLRTTTRGRLSACALWGRQVCSLSIPLISPSTPARLPLPLTWPESACHPHARVECRTRRRCFTSASRAGGTVLSPRPARAPSGKDGASGYSTNREPFARSASRFGLRL